MKKNLIKVLAVLALVPTLVFSGCGNNDESSKADDTSSATTTSANEESKTEDLSLKNIIDKGEFILGLDASFPPMGFTDENDNIVGFDIDVAKEVCSRLNITLKTQPIDWDSKEAELDAGNIDCIWNGMSINPGRAEAMNLSDPYMNNSMVFVVRKDSDIKSQADLAGKNIAVQNGSSAQDILVASDVSNTAASIVDLKDNPSAFVELELNTVDAVFVDSIVANYYIASQNKDYVILEDGLEEEEYAIGFRKGDQALRDEIQKTLSEMKADGKLAEISTTWFGKDVTTVK